MNEKIVFICGIHKSGTSLVRSIFDGHSQIFSIPFETHPFQHLGRWIDNDYRKRRPKNFDTDEIIKNFKSWIKQANINRNKYGDSDVRGAIDEEIFNNEIRLINNKMNSKQIINTYFQAITKSIISSDAKNYPKVLVEKSVENAEFVWELSTYFPEAKFIHIIRNPYTNLISLRRFKSVKFGYPIMRRLLRTMYNNYYYMYKNLELVDNYHIIKYEDLLLDPVNKINDMFQYVGLKPEEINYIPTSIGKLWKGNSTNDKIFKGISSENLKHGFNSLHPMEVFFINKLFPFLFNDYGYEKIEKNGSFWRPAPGENFRRYVANRFYRFILV